MSATAIAFIEAPQRYRVRVGFDAAPSTSASAYTLTRVDGSPCEAHPSLVWVEAGNPCVAELALSEPLLEGQIYSLAVSGAGNAPVAYRTPQAPGAPDPATGASPASSAFGTDRCWLVDALGAGRRMQRRSGLAALKYDLATIAVIHPGELFHLPSDGVGLPRRVNGPGNNTELQAMGADLRRQWSKDRRVRRGSVAVKVTADGTGLVQLEGGYQAEATGDKDTIRRSA